MGIASVYQQSSHKFKCMCEITRERLLKKEKVAVENHVIYVNC